MTTVTGEAIVAEARKYLGTRWTHHGNNTNGIDCKNLVVNSAVSAGIVLSNPDEVLARDYRDEHTKLRIEAALREECCDIEITHIAVGDIILFCFPGMDQIHHIGMASLTDGNRWWFIHSDAKMGRVVETALTDDWRAKIVAVWRWKGLCNG